MAESRPADRWHTLNPYLMTLKEDQVEALLAAERAGANRPRFVRRIMSRRDRLRKERERSEVGE